MLKFFAVGALALASVSVATLASRFDGAAEASPPIAQAERYLLTNRLLGTSCLIRRDGAEIEPLGACKDTFEGVRRIHALRGDARRMTFVDPLGSAVIDFAWNEETGMSSVSSPLHPEAGALTLVPVRTASARG